MKITTLIILLSLSFSAFGFLGGSKGSKLVKKFQKFDRYLARDIQKDIELFKTKDSKHYRRLSRNTDKFCRKSKSIGYQWTDACNFYQEKMKDFPKPDKYKALSRNSERLLGNYKKMAQNAKKLNNDQKIVEKCKHVLRLDPHDKECKKWSKESSARIAKAEKKRKAALKKKQAIWAKKKKEKELKAAERKKQWELEKKQEKVVEKARRAKINSKECIIAELRSLFCKKAKITVYYTTLIENYKGGIPQIKKNYKMGLMRALQIQKKYSDSLKKEGGALPECNIQVNLKYVTASTSAGIQIPPDVLGKLKTDEINNCKLSNTEKQAALLEVNNAN